MAGPFATIERFFERLFERPAARLFQGRVEPIHLQRHLERAMEAQRVVRARQSHVPSYYRMVLSPSDLASLEVDRDRLAAQLAERLHAHARRRGFTLTARPGVELRSSTSVMPGDVMVEATTPAPATAEGTNGPRSTALNPHSARPSAAESAAAGAAIETALPEGTMIFRAAQPDAPRAVLALRVAGQPAARVPVTGATMRLGRATDNDVVLADERVSRHHGQIGVRLGMLVYADLGSTNGSYLNGSRVTEIALGPGDILQLGSSTLTIEPGS